MKRKSDKVKDAIQDLAEEIASGNWGAWECSLGALVALVQLTNNLGLGDEFWSDIFTIKEQYRNKVKSIVNADPKDFLNR